MKTYQIGQAACKEVFHSAAVSIMKELQPFDRHTAPTQWDSDGTEMRNASLFIFFFCYIIIFRVKSERLRIILLCAFVVLFGLEQ